MPANVCELICQNRLDTGDGHVRKYCRRQQHGRAHNPQYRGSKLRRRRSTVRRGGFLGVRATHRRASSGGHLSPCAVREPLGAGHQPGRPREHRRRSGQPHNRPRGVPQVVTVMNRGCRRRDSFVGSRQPVIYQAAQRESPGRVFMTSARLCRGPVVSWAIARSASPAAATCDRRSNTAQVTRQPITTVAILPRAIPHNGRLARARLNGPAPVAARPPRPRLATNCEQVPTANAAKVGPDSRSASCMIASGMLTIGRQPPPFFFVASASTRRISSSSSASTRVLSNRHCSTWAGLPPKTFASMSFISGRNTCCRLAVAR